MNANDFDFPCRWRPGFRAEKGVFRQEPTEKKPVVSAGIPEYSKLACSRWRDESESIHLHSEKNLNLTSSETCIFRTTAEGGGDKYVKSYGTDRRIITPNLI